MIRYSSKLMESTVLLRQLEDAAEAGGDEFQAIVQDIGRRMSDAVSDVGNDLLRLLDSEPTSATKTEPG